MQAAGEGGACFDPHEVGAARVAEGAKQVRDTNHLTAKQADAKEKALGDALAAKGKKGGSANLAPTTIPTYIHVIQEDASTGAVPQANIDAQLDVLNAAYAVTRVASTVAGQGTTTDHRPGTRSAPGIAGERKAKTALRQGGDDALNVYTARSATVFSVGRPSRRTSEHPRRTVVVILYGTLPGGSAAPYDDGDTATHEVGHWLGPLPHLPGWLPRQGDQVDDTPAEAAPPSAARPAATPAHGSGPRPDPQLHGLHRGRVHVRVHAGSGAAHDRRVGGVPRLI